jgi:hypothetical protein
VNEPGRLLPAGTKQRRDMLVEKLMNKTPLTDVERAYEIGLLDGLTLAQYGHDLRDE